MTGNGHERPTALIAALGSSRFVAALAVWVLVSSCTSAALNDSSVTTAAVSALASDFFASREVRQIVLFICDETDRLLVQKHLSADGRFLVEAPLPATYMSGERLLRSLPTVGLLLWNFPSPDDEFLINELIDVASYNGSYHWLLMGSSEITNLEPHLRLDSEITVATPTAENQWELVEVFHANNRVVEERVGLWSPASQNRCAVGSSCLSGARKDPQATAAIAESPWHPSIAVRRLHISGVPVRAVLYMWKIVEPAVMNSLLGLSREEATPLLTSLSMHGYQLFMNVVHRFNMTVMEVIPNTKPGQIDAPPSGLFDGCVGVVQRGEAEVEPGVVITPDRTRIMVFAVTTWSLNVRCGFLSNNALGSVDALVKPFETGAWLVVVGLAAVTLLLGKGFRSVEQLTPEQGGTTWSDVLMSSFGTFTGQGFYACGDWMSGRALLLVVEVFFFLTEAYYGAAIVYFLLSPPPNNIRTPHDLTKSNYKGMAHDWTHTRRALANSTDPLVREVYQSKVKPPRGLGFQPTDRVLRALKKPWVALFAADDVVDSATNALTSGEACRLVVLDVETPSAVAVGTAKGAAFKEMINSGTLLQLERGIAYREKRVWRQRRAACQGGGSDSFAPVEVLPLLPTFVLLAVSVLVSAALCLAERAAASRWRRRNGAAQQEGSCSETGTTCKPSGVPGPDFPSALPGGRSGGLAVDESLMEFLQLLELRMSIRRSKNAQES